MKHAKYFNTAKRLNFICYCLAIACMILFLTGIPPAMGGTSDAAGGVKDQGVEADGLGEGTGHLDLLLKKLHVKWSGDFDGMVERRVIRALVTFSKTFYFLDKADQRGASYEMLKAFEKEINKRLKRRHLKVHVVLIPVPRDALIPALIQGKGDSAAAGLCITSARKKVVDFSDPLVSKISEVVVSGPGGPKLKTLDDLSGREIHVRQSSNYYETLVGFNAAFKKAGKPEIVIKAADEYLEDEDLLEMVNAGLIPMVVVDNYRADLWSKIFKNIVPHPHMPLRKGGQVAWMIRKNSPQLKKVVNAFVKGHKQGTLFGNIIIKRYAKSTKWIRNALAHEDLGRLKAVAALFKKYGAKYDMDWLLVAACAYQESRLDQSKRSPVGAVGVMQILPDTAAGYPIHIPDIEQLEPNIHAGVKYLRWIYETYFKDTDMDLLNKGLFTFASYNAGPNKIKRLRKQARKMGLDPDVWFRNVEMVAAKRIGRETVQYVSNIYKYYLAYRFIAHKLDMKKELKTKKKSK